MNSTDILIESLFTLMNKKIPESVLYEAQKCILDYFGNTIAGTAMLKDKILAYLDNFDRDPESVTLIAMGRKASLHNATFLNGMNSHVAELDDGHRFCGAHLGATVLPALLAVAEYEKLSGEDILRGVIIGYEAEIRLGRSIQPSHKNRGFHISGTCGTIGAAIGIAAALGFSKGKMKDALSAAANSSAGFLEALMDASELKPYNIGRASMDGLIAAFTARAGFKGPDDVLGGRRGLFAAMTDKYDPSGLSLETDFSYNIENIYRKPYAACRLCHPAIEAVMHLRSNNEIDSKDVKQINVYTFKQAVIGHDYSKIQGVSSAKMSMPFCVALALKIGKAGIQEFMPEYIEDPEILLLAEKVKVHPDDSLSALVPQKRAAIVEIITNNGKHLRDRVDYPKGEPENPLSTKELEEKFTSLAVYGGKSEEDAKQIIQQVWALEKNPAKLFDLLT